MTSKNEIEKKERKNLKIKYLKSKNFAFKSKTT